MNNYQTEQEFFWAGDFGNDYTDRNSGVNLLASKISFFSKVLQKCRGGVSSILELGANQGLNLSAIGMLLPNVKMTAVEINKKAADKCRNIDRVTVLQESIFDFNTNEKFDLTFTKGVLIHINPEKLHDVYKKLYEYSKRYILVSEYYNPTPVEVKYRGNDGKLFKRDFCGELMDNYSDLQLVDYGFLYHRDETFPDDDNTWFLLEKNKR